VGLDAAAVRMPPYKELIKTMGGEDGRKTCGLYIAEAVRQKSLWKTSQLL
jgi:hypothetical protein